MKFAAGGHINHSLVWQNLALTGPRLSDAAKVTPIFGDTISVKYYSLLKCKPDHEGVLLSIKGVDEADLLLARKMGHLTSFRLKKRALLWMAVSASTFGSMLIIFST